MCSAIKWALIMGNDGWVIVKSCPALCDLMDCSLPVSSALRFSRQEYWSALPFSSPVDLPDPGIELGSPELAGGFLTLSYLRKTRLSFKQCFIWHSKIIFLLNTLLCQTQKRCPFQHRDWNAKVESQEMPAVTDKFGLGLQNEAGQRLIEFCQENALVIANTLFQQHKRRLYTWTSPDGQYRNQIDYIFASKNGAAL